MNITFPHIDDNTINLPFKFDDYGFINVYYFKEIKRTDEIFKLSRIKLDSIDNNIYQGIKDHRIFPFIVCNTKADGILIERGEGNNYFISLVDSVSETTYVRIDNLFPFQPNFYTSKEQAIETAKYINKLAVKKMKEVGIYYED